MPYIDENLMDGETIIYEGRLSFWALAKWAVPGFLMTPFIFSQAIWGFTVFALGIGMMTTALIMFATTEMAVTSQRVISKRGWIARKTTEISLARVEGVEVNQTIVQRMLDYGHILVSGVGSHKAKIADVASPMSFRKAFLTALKEFEDSSRAVKVIEGDGLGRERGQEVWAEGTDGSTAGHSRSGEGLNEALGEIAKLIVVLNGQLLYDKAAVAAAIVARAKEQPALLDLLNVEESHELMRLALKQGQE